MRTIRIRSSLLFRLVLVGVVSSPAAREAYAQAEPSGSPQPRSWDLDFQPSFGTSFDRLWGRYLDAESEGDTQQMERLLREIRRLRVERNVFHLYGVSLASAYKAAQHLAREELDQAEAHYQIARELDPFLPTAYYGLAKVARRSGGLGVLTSIGYSLRAFGVSFLSSRDREFAFLDMLLYGGLLFVLVCGVFTVLMLYRYGALVFHDLKERFSAKIGDLGVLAACLAVFLLPLMLSFGYGWLAPYWLTLTFAYQSRVERWVSILALLFLVMVGPLAEFHSQRTNTMRNPQYRASASSVYGTFEPTDLRILQVASYRDPEDRDLLFLVATLYKVLGEYELSASRYRSILQQWPDDLPARVNLGNIYFAQRDWEGALFEYERAIETDPGFALAFYNKSLAHAETFEFRDREAARIRAESLDMGMVSAHERRSGEFAAVLDRRLSLDEIRARFYGLEEGRHNEPLRPSWLRGWTSGPGVRLFFGAMVLGGLILLLDYSVDRKHSRHCRKCGMAFCGRCQIGTGRRGLCTQCYHLFYIKDGVSAAARDQKTAQVAKANQRSGVLFRVLSIVAPGAGHIAQEMTLLGLILLLLWVGGALFLVTGSRFYGLPGEFLGVGSTTSPYLALGVMLVVLVVANTAAQPRPQG